VGANAVDLIALDSIDGAFWHGSARQAFA
jgi:hypothetical protein